MMRTLVHPHRGFDAALKPAFAARRKDRPRETFQPGDLVTFWEHKKPSIYKVLKVDSGNSGYEGAEVQLLFNENIQSPKAKQKPMSYSTFWLKKVTREQVEGMIKRWQEILAMLPPTS